jgi:FecR protein
VRWLENPRDEAELKVRVGLDLAAGRTDELALRRVWGRLVDLPPFTRRASRWAYLLAGMVVAGGLAAAIGFVWPLLRPASLPVTMLPMPAPELPPVPLEPEPVLLGPTTVTTGAREARTVRLKGGARVQLRSQTTLAVDAGQRPALQRGRVQMEVPHQEPGDTFTVAAGPYVIVVVGTTFDVGVDKSHVEVDVSEGVVEVWRDGEMVRLPAGKSWRGAARIVPRRRVAAPVERAAPPPVPLPPHPADRFAEAKVMLRSGDTAGALEILRELAAGSGPTAENSGYEIGQVLRFKRQQPRAAIQAWNRYRNRFPDGLLRVEADVSVIDTLLELGDRVAARVEAEAFLKRHPVSERRDEIARLADRLRRTQEDGGSSARSGR